jgi:energy-coupling factor transport system permease protein
MSLFEGLRFRPGNTFIHRLDPRVKLLVSLALLTTAIIYVDVLIVVSLLALEAALVSAAKVGRLWRKTLRGSIQLAVLVFVITFISQYSREPQLLVAAGYSLAYSLRLIVFLSSFSYEYSFAFVSAIRFTPVMAEELKTVMDAQRSRGLELDKGPFMRRLRNLVPVLVPLLVNVIRRSYELAEAMEVKCFGAAKKRTSLRVLEIKRNDVIFLVAAMVLFILAISVKVMGLEPVKTIPYLRMFFPS